MIRFFAWCMLITFSQRAGAGLLLHTLLHKSVNQESSLNDHRTISGNNCTCVDDLSMPYEPAPAQVLCGPTKLTVMPMCIFVPVVLDTSLIFESLRGPPSLHTSF